MGLEQQEVIVRCARCERTTTDPDKWDPEAETGKVYCDRCWPRRAEPVSVAERAQRILDDHSFAILVARDANAGSGRPTTSSVDEICAALVALADFTTETWS